MPPEYEPFMPGVVAYGEPPVHPASWHACWTIPCCRQEQQSAGTWTVCCRPGADCAVYCTAKGNATLKEGFYGAQGSQHTVTRLHYPSQLLHGMWDFGEAESACGLDVSCAHGKMCTCTLQACCTARGM